MDRDTELKKLINVLYRTGKMAYRVQWTDSGEDSARFCAEQYNRILARLRELDPEIGSIFAPLAPDASLTVISLACKQVVSYYEDEMRERGFHDREPFDFGFRPGRVGAAFCMPGQKDFEDFGNMIRDWVQGWRTGGKGCGPEKSQKTEEAPKEAPAEPAL